MPEIFWMMFAVWFPFAFVYFLQKVFPGSVWVKKEEGPKTIFTDYEEYSTAQLLGDAWFDNSRVGVCGKCGCDDAPTVGGLYYDICKWCAELDSVTYHLRWKSKSKTLRKQLSGDYI